MDNLTNTLTVLRRVRKLRRLAGSPNPHEAALAAAKARDLSDQHQVSDLMLTLAELIDTHPHARRMLKDALRTALRARSRPVPRVRVRH
jgi:hypothetical protein